MARSNLRVETHAVVAQILLEGRCAVGVRYRQNGAMAELRAEREVILAGGAWSSRRTGSP
jgi:choline dehydrogenase